MIPGQTAQSAQSAQLAMRPQGNAAAISAIFDQAAGSGRSVLNRPELERLLAHTGIQSNFGVAQPAQAAVGGIADLRISLNRTREFGMVLSAGFGGVDGELDETNFRKDRATVHAAVELTDAADFLALFRRTLVYQKLCALSRRHGQVKPDAQLEDCFGRLIELGRHDSNPNPTEKFVLQSLELNPVECAGQLSVRDARCEFGAPPARRLARPIPKIDKLLHPKSIGIIGVSGSGMNFGRIILRNLMGSGYPKEQLLIIRPDESEIDGIRCVPNLKALEQKLDLLIVAVAANVVYGLVDEIIATNSVESVILTPGSLGETRKSREPASAMVARINAAHGSIADGGPIFIGANCLGVVSHPGGYDSWFIPLERLPKPQKKPERNSVLISQSGAFMISRLSQNPWLDPLYMMALGNQTDLTHGDLLSFFAERPEIETIGIYVEGFKDGDGLDFAKAARKALLNGKQVVVYKSGRSVPGVNGVMGHTASIAGDYTLFESVVRQAGAIVVEDFSA
ncbi:MAG: CoA-binding protein, partial [Sterolibacterium sp.]